MIPGKSTIFSLINSLTGEGKKMMKMALYLLNLRVFRMLKPVKNLIYLSCVLCFFASCTATRQTATVSKAAPEKASSGSPRFLENITISPLNVSAPSPSAHKPLVKNISKPAMSFDNLTNIEKCSLLQFKFGILLDKPVETVWNERLITFLEDWYGVPYRYGGSTKKGIDCSAFTCQLMNKVYGITLPRTSRDQFEAVSQISKKNLEQGDLVFFNTRGRASHVGVYLGNNKFVHASTSSGVMISDLDDSYFSKRFAGSGRIR